MGLKNMRTDKESKADEDLRMSLVALKNKILLFNKNFKTDYFVYAIEYLKDSQEITKKR